VVRKLESPRVRAREETKAALSDANEVARTQLIRFRRRLGSLTHEQERQIENLLISTVSKISLAAAEVMETMTKSPLTTLEWLETRPYEQEADDCKISPRSV
jgi:hypothetical protein